jgi:hypothetical protein
MKHLKPFTQFINESAEPSYTELTPAQLEVMQSLSEDLKSEVSNSLEVAITESGNIRFESNQNVHDWMDLEVYGESVRMYLEQIVLLKPVFLQLDEMDETDIDRLIDLGLIDDPTKCLKIGNQYLEGFLVDSLTEYWSKDVSFNDKNETRDYWYSIGDLGVTAIEDLANDLANQVNDWMNEDAATEMDLQARLDKQFPEHEDEEDEDWEDDEDETDED